MSLLEVLSVARTRAPSEGARSAAHSGNMGDIVCALPTVAALGVESLTLNLVDDPGVGGRRLTEGGARFLTPLLLAQPGIAEVVTARAPFRMATGIRRDAEGGRGPEVARGLPLEEVPASALGVDHVLDRFRLQPVGSLNLVEAHARAQGVAVDAGRPWIARPTLGARRGGILLSVTARYRHSSNQRLAELLAGFGPVTMVGGREEREAVAGLPGEFIEAADALELASLIAGSDLFIGVPSLPYAIAEGLKHPRLLDLPEWPVNAFPIGPGGWVLPADLEEGRRLIANLLAGGGAEVRAALRVMPPTRAGRRRKTLTAQILHPSTDRVIAQESLAITSDCVTHGLALDGALDQDAITLAFLLDHWVALEAIRIETGAGATAWRFGGDETSIRATTTARFALLGGRLLLNGRQSHERLDFILPVGLGAGLAKGDRLVFDAYSLTDPIAIGAAGDALAARTAMVRDLHRKRAEDGRVLAEERARLADRERLLAEGRAERMALEDRVAELDRAVEGWRGEVAERERRLSVLLGSTSWRVTLPMRLALQGARWVARRSGLAGVKTRATRSVRRAGGKLLRALPLPPATRRRLHLLAARAAERALGTPGPVVATASLALPVPGAPVGLAIPGGVAEAPLVSVIIPVYGKVEITLACLDSIALAMPRAPIEVIVVDDASPDDTAARLGGRTDIRLVRNPENLGFIGSCNHGAAEARAPYLLFLNNDTQVLPGWLDTLVDDFAANPNAGIVGSKLIYPDGRLQEAGGIIWSDASGWNWGRLQNPDDPAYEFPRAVDYVSGASLLIPARLFNAVGGFDRRYKPAYYEDTDLAFQVRSLGLDVLYQPRSRVIHFEGVTSGTDLGSGVKAYQLINQKTFRARWAPQLARHGDSEQRPVGFADRRVLGRVLIIDACTPTPDQDSGSIDMMNLIRILIGMGLRVSFVPESNFLHFGAYTEALQALGVECLHAPYFRSVGEIAKARGDVFDLVILTRYAVAEAHISTIRRYCPSAKVIFNTVDLHYLRERRAAEMSGSASALSAAEATRRAELAVVAAADATIVLSTVERDLLVEQMPTAALAIIPVIRDIPGRLAPAAGRRDIMFVGGFNHQPNGDAVAWFIEEIWPRVRRAHPDARFHIVGSNMPPAIAALAGAEAGIVAHGFVEDLTELFTTIRLTVAPLRYGAGIKGKVATSLGYGVPCVATPIAVEGTGLGDEREVLVAADPAAFADAIGRLLTDDGVWDRLSDAGLAFVEAQYALDANRGRVAALLARLDAPPFAGHCAVCGHQGRFDLGAEAADWRAPRCAACGAGPLARTLAEAAAGASKEAPAALLVDATGEVAPRRWGSDRAAPDAPLDGVVLDSWPAPTRLLELGRRLKAGGWIVVAADAVEGVEGAIRARAAFTAAGLVAERPGPMRASGVLRPSVWVARPAEQASEGGGQTP